MDIRCLFAILLACFTALAVTGETGGAAQASGAVRIQAAEVLQRALREASMPGVSPKKQREILVQASRWATARLGPGALAAQRLNSAVQQAETPPGGSPEAGATMLRRVLTEIEKDLSFQLRVEAKQPTGFPAPTPVGEVELKNYPAYRKARAETSPNLAFWTLFSHIKKNDIAMTAPVEMGYTFGPLSQPKEQNMSFLYAESVLGKPGKAGSVEVLDVPPMTVVSTGVRGAQTVQSVLGARRRLETWLESNRSTWTPEGPMRTMAYNSPFVPRDQNYFEVEIPMRHVGQKVADRTEER